MACVCKDGSASGFFLAGRHGDEACEDGLTETVPAPTEKIPASQLFDAINEQLSENPEEVKDAIRKGNGIFAFTIKGNSGVTDSWHVDLKTTGRVGKGIGEKPSGKTSGSTPAASEL